MHILDTERLRLRTIEADDAAFYLVLINDESWLKNIGDKGVRSLDQARAAILAGPCASQARHGFSLYLVERREDGAALGMCGLIKRDSLPDVDIGYAIAPRYWGRGYAYEAAAAVVAHAERDLGLERLLGITDPENVKSNRMLLKLGLRFERFVLMPPDDRGTNVYRREFREACC
ncbi:MAG TPA: GNAT family N-acetyltransferase [Janthinobacterium sp.]|nr:GNAT family N-acetyltransferase [Janthinobacterium sp.]